MFHNSRESWPKEPWPTNAARVEAVEAPRSRATSPGGDGRSQAVAAAGLNYVQPGVPTIIGHGPLARLLADGIATDDCHILSPSIDVIRALLPRPNVRMTLPSGTCFPDRGIIVSPYDDPILRHFAAGRIFICAEGLSAEGVLLRDAVVVQTLRQWLARASEVVVLACSRHFSPAAGLSLCPLSRIGTLIVDDGIPADLLKTLVMAGVKIHMVTPPAG